MTLWFVLLALLVFVGLMLHHMVVLTRDLRGYAKRERSLRHLARTLSGTVSVEEVARQAANDAVSFTPAFGAYVERARDGAIEVIASAGERAPPTAQIHDYHKSLTEVAAPATEPVRIKAGTIGRLVAPYLDRWHGCSGLVVPLSVYAGTQDAAGALVLLREPEHGNVTAPESAYARALGDFVIAAMRRTLLVEREHAARTEAEAAVRDRDQVLRVVAHDCSS